jgi:hypothetical protein
VTGPGAWSTSLAPSLPVHAVEDVLPASCLSPGFESGLSLVILLCSCSFASVVCTKHSQMHLVVSSFLVTTSPALFALLEKVVDFSAAPTEPYKYSPGPLCSPGAPCQACD